MTPEEILIDLRHDAKQRLRTEESDQWTLHRAFTEKVSNLSDADIFDQKKTSDAEKIQLCSLLIITMKQVGTLSPQCYIDLIDLLQAILHDGFVPHWKRDNLPGLYHILSRIFHIEHPIWTYIPIDD